MTVTANWATLTFSIPQADLTNVTGTLYEMETKTYLKAEIDALMASEDGIVFEDAIDHNTEYTVAGITYAAKVEIINGYSLTFTPDSQWTVRLTGSNNNVFDVENGILNQNQVQVISNNSAGLQIVTQGSGVTAQDKVDIANQVWLEVLEGTLTAEQMMRIVAAATAGKLSGAGTTNVKIRDLSDTKDRIDATVDESGNRTAVTVDGS